MKSLGFAYQLSLQLKCLGNVQGHYECPDFVEQLLKLRSLHS